MAGETFGIYAAMQSGFHFKTGQSGALAMRRLAERQARVGIIANQVNLALPNPTPRDVWTRWPNLQSARRQKRKTAVSRDQRLAQDHVLNGEKLTAFTKEMRSTAQGGEMSQVELRGAKAGSLGVRASGSERFSHANLRKLYPALIAAIAVWLGIGAMWWWGP